MKKIITNQNGAIAIVTALLLTAFLGLAALGIDSGYMVATKNELQNAADAGALAGAWQLSNGEDENAIKQTVLDTVGKNKASNGNISLNFEDITIGKWDWISKKVRPPNPKKNEKDDAVQVTIQNHNLNLFFRSDNESLDAQAVAIAAGGGDGDLIPLAVDTEFKESDIGNIFTIWGDNLSPGNWGTVNLDKDDNGAAGASTIRKWLDEGYKGILKIGNYISRQPGQGAIVSNPDIVEARKNDPDRAIVVVPVVDEFHQGSGGGNNKTDKLSKVIGFAIMQIWATEYKNKNKIEKVTAKYLGPATPGGGGGGGANSGGKAIVLVK